VYGLCCLALDAQARLLALAIYYRVLTDFADISGIFGKKGRERKQPGPPHRGARMSNPFHLAPLRRLFFAQNRRHRIVKTPELQIFLPLYLQALTPFPPKKIPQISTKTRRSL